MTALAAVETSIQNLDAEVAILGGLLREPRHVDGVADKLRGADFAEPFFGHVFDLIVREHSLGRSLNPVTIRPYLEGQAEFDQLGGRGWLANLTAGAFAVASMESAEQIAELSRRRALIEGLRTAIGQAGDMDVPIGDVITAADDTIASTRDADGADHEFSGAECIGAVIEGFGAPVTGAECGNIPSIDRLLGPMRPGHLVIGAGRPGMGKTATAVSYALGAAARGHGVLFVSLEMGAAELGERMAADMCLAQRIPYEAIRDRTLKPEQQREVCRARDRLAELPLQIIDKGGLSIGQLRTMVRRWARRFAARGNKLELIIVDYLQLMRADRKMDRYEVVTEISHSLKEIAKEHGAAVFALAQLSRAVEQRADKRPMLSDLRESGQIEQDADAVLFFLRDEYYLRLIEPHPNDPKHAEWEQKLQDCQGRIEFICAKRRNGSTGSLVGEFLYHYQAVRG